jgi:hypothetical protein
MSALDEMIASMSVAEVARLANTTVEKIVAAAMSSEQPRSNGQSPLRTVAAAASSQNVSVARGGVRLDQLLKVVAGARAPVDINTIGERIGGSAAQVRAALKKLHAAGWVKVSGQRKGTRYTAA